jgi:hypothetical protein
MVANKRANILLYGVVGLLFAAGIGGCACPDDGHKRQVVLPCSVLTDPCHGYHPTCWQTWSPCCPACPAPVKEDCKECTNTSVKIYDEDEAVHVLPPPPMANDKNSSSFFTVGWDERMQNGSRGQQRF